MNKPPVLNALLVPSYDADRLGSIDAPVITYWLRPISLALWVFIFASQTLSILISGEGNYLLLGLITLLFFGVQLQYWYEESQQGLRFRQTMERVRGQVFEDDVTGLPNSRHFLAELRRQMMRSMRSGHAFSLVLVDVSGVTDIQRGDEILVSVAHGLRRALKDSDFVARLEGGVFAGIVTDEDSTIAAKCEAVHQALYDAVPRQVAGRVRIASSITAYEGETEVRRFLRRAHKDLLRERTSPLDPSARGRLAAS